MAVVGASGTTMPKGLCLNLHCELGFFFFLFFPSLLECPSSGSAKRCISSFYLCRELKTVQPVLPETKQIGWKSIIAATKERNRWTWYPWKNFCWALLRPSKSRRRSFFQLILPLEEMFIRLIVHSPKGLPWRVREGIMRIPFWLSLFSTFFAANVAGTRFWREI